MLDILDPVVETLDKYWSIGFTLEELKSLWKEYSYLLGIIFTVNDIDKKVISGKVIDITDFGSLIIEDNYATKHELVVGNVEILSKKEEKKKKTRNKFLYKI